MALSNNNNPMVMPVAPMNNYGSGSGWGNGFGGDGAWWLLVLFLFMFNGNGWNNWGGNGMNGAIPYMMSNTTNNDVQRGFDQQSIMGGINGINAAVNNGFANAEIGRCNSQANILQTLNNNQASMISSMNSLAMGLQNCCCENRAGLSDLKYTVATENCADRQALSDGIRDIIANNTAQTQVILDKMCQQELNAKDEIIANLRSQLSTQNLASQILSDNSRQTAVLEDYLNPVARPAYLVQNPNGCPQNSCGCATC